MEDDRILGSASMRIAVAQPINRGQISTTPGTIQTKGNAMEKTELRFTRGPRLLFTGEMLGSKEWESRKGRLMRIEIWQTEAGALIGARYSRWEDEKDWSESEAIVVECPILDADNTDMMLHRRMELRERDMRFALLDWFQWEDRARTLARNLKWSLTREVA